MPYCRKCERSFSNRFGYIQHLLNSSNHNYCHAHGLDFSSPLGLKEHYVQSPEHAYCQYCVEHFDDEWDLEDHNDAFHVRCEDCNRFFKNEFGLHEHYRQSPYHRDQYCTPCRRLFTSENAYKNHLRSSIHQPKNVMCPGRGCGMGFVSTSALALHLESGGCPSGITRAEVNRIIRHYDRNNVITDPSRMIGNGGRGDDVTYYATGASWNGWAYECCICHKEYSTLRALNQHLGSPRHQSKIYVCPWSTCGARFTTLSGFCQHVESESCDVLRANPLAKRIVDGAVRNMRTITY
ncbi:hypothetical protein CC1G_00609 [Coprinopsis cinerea okayama7|uniref:C2H2-type domain-containing protein n=1 Tax=Coprinopsis cinerea (strain Okayama-7 / 130 / ATCC MYA-4618 / FGSC 9003) TaxID=240176 RepID=A8N3J0_COPC7|nr:hypothetical protein CC1G_00609 [Coprinopsis cinerea okayama7\|eukprot:XP_001829430.1 hypothetical protein CC1G_00609 [Coprinopsis cinerea okayama7\